MLQLGGQTLSKCFSLKSCVVVAHYISFTSQYASGTLCFINDSNNICPYMECNSSANVLQFSEDCSTVRIETY